MIRPGDPVRHGWFFDGTQQVFHDAKGNFFVAGQWYYRLDLLAAASLVPPAPTWHDQARMEFQRLSTPWPTYKEAWREARENRSWCHRWAKWGALPVFWLGCLILLTHDWQPNDWAPFTVQFWLALVAWLTYPFAFWAVYFQALRRRDGRKAAAFAVASYAAVAAGAHAMRVHGERHPVQEWTPYPQRPFR